MKEKLVGSLVARFSEFEIIQVLRTKNGVANSLVSLASSLPQSRAKSPLRYSHNRLSRLARSIK